MNIQKNVSLAPYTTYNVGGPADYFTEVHTRKELIRSLLYAKNNKLKWTMLGLGANVLISDEGFRGLVIKNNYKTEQVTTLGKELGLPTKIKLGSGNTLTEVIDFTQSLSLSGFEHFAGIPSTIGGALFQNVHFLKDVQNHDAGTFFIEELFYSATVFDVKNNHELVLFKEDMKFAYDYSILHKTDLVVLDATFELKKAPREEIQKVIDANLEWRRMKHPSNFSCGSVFKKIKDIGAGRLIDECGLKGFGIGDVRVSHKHANFITHTGKESATAENILKVIKHVQKTVFEETGHQLELEIKLVGDFDEESS